MIRKLVLFGWLATAVLVTSFVTGYRVVPGSDYIPNHLLSSIVAFGTLGLVFACTSLYLLGMGRLVRSVTREDVLDGHWQRDHRRLARPALRWCSVGLASLLGAVLSGYPTHVGSWKPTAHHALAWIAFVATVVALWRLRPLVTREEALVRSLDRSLEG